MKKLLAWGMAVVLCLGLLPLGSMASEEVEEPVEAEYVEVAIEDSTEIGRDSFAEDEHDEAISIEESDSVELSSNNSDLPVEDDTAGLMLDGYRSSINASEVASYMNGLVGQTNNHRGYCLLFVTNCWVNMGFAGSYDWGNATNFANHNTVSTSKDNIPIGADVFFTSSDGNGHIGIYVGDGYFVHAGSANTYEKSSLSEAYYSNRYTGWGWHPNVTVIDDGSTSVTIPEGIYYIRSALSNDYVLGVAGASTSWGANVQLEKSNNATSQQFQIVSYDGKYAIKNVNSGCALDVANSSSDSGTNVQQYYYWPDQTAAQRWFFEDCGDGYYYIRSELGTYLDVQGGVAANGQNVQTYTGNGTTAQKFKLEVIHPTAPRPPQVEVHGTNVTVSWNDVSYETSYNVYLLQEPCSWDDVKYSATVSADQTSYTFSGVAFGDYYAFIISMPNDVDVQSGWTSFSVERITTNPPTIDVHGTSVTVSWNDVLGETSYNIYLLQEPWSWNDIKYSATVNADQTTYTFSNVAFGDYCAFIIAMPNDKDVQSGWTAFSVERITTDPPTVSVNGRNVTVSWNDVLGETSYNVYLLQEPCTWEDIKYSVTVSANQTAYTFSDIADGEYYAFIIAMPNDVDVQSGWTAFSVSDIPFYQISYNPNGGTGAPDAQTKTHDTALTLSDAKPERQYYIFLGWAKTSTATTAAYKPGDSYSDNADAILYAVWYKIEYSAPGAAVLLKYGYPLEASTVLKQIIGIG